MVEPAEIEDVALAFWSLGAETVELGSGRCCSRPGTAADGPANFLHRLRPHSVADLDAVLVLARTLCRRVVLDVGTPSWVEAELVSRDWRVDHLLQLVLPVERPLVLPSDPPLRLGTPAARAEDLRPVIDTDWPAVLEMLRIDHAEEDRRAGRAPRPRRYTDDALAVRRAIARHADYMVATVDDVPVGFVCSWVGPRRVGVVEDVFVHPDHRRRGMASALIAAVVAQARRRGAADVSIAADPADTPKRLYARLGFAPWSITRTLTSPD